MGDQRYWAGIDAGFESAAICVIDSTDNIVRELMCSVEPEAVDQALSDYRAGLELIGIEAGTGTHLTRRLRAGGYSVEVFEARRARRFLSIRRNKTDTTDARGLAELTKYGRGAISRVRVKPIKMQHLRSRLVMRDKLVRQRVTIDNVLRSLVRLHGGKRISTSTARSLRNSVEGELARIEAEDGVALHGEALPLLDLCSRLRSYIELIDRDLEATAKRIDECRRFMAIPGVGPLTALAFFSTVGDPSRFRRGRDVAAYLGLAPRVHQSGIASKQCGITKMGDKMTRRLLVIAAMSMLRQVKRESELRAWAIQLAGRAGRAKSRVALARKLAIVMISMWKTGAEFVPGPTLAATDTL